MSSSKRDNDFFNLNSDESDSDDKNDDKQKTSIWDWDKPENYNLYQDNVKVNSTKRVLNDNEVINSNKKFLKLNENNNKKSNEIKIENQNDFIQYASNINTNKYLKCNLTAHKESVNRIYWSKKPDNRNLLLSSSMDG